MSKPANAMRFVIAILLAALVGGPAVAQQNPFVGTWGESGRTLNGRRHLRRLLGLLSKWHDALVGRGQRRRPDYPPMRRLSIQSVGPGN